AALGLVAVRAAFPRLRVRVIVDVSRGQLPREWRTLLANLGMVPVEAGARLAAARLGVADLAAVMARMAPHPRATAELITAFNAQGSALIPKGLERRAGLA